MVINQSCNILIYTQVIYCLFIFLNLKDAPWTSQEFNLFLLGERLKHNCADNGNYENESFKILMSLNVHAHEHTFLNSWRHRCPSHLNRHNLLYRVASFRRARIRCSLFESKVPLLVSAKSGPMGCNKSSMICRHVAGYSEGA